MSESNDSSNVQIEHTEGNKAGETNEEKINHAADDMAGKASRVQGKDESSINTGGVTPGGGGIFSK